MLSHSFLGSTWKCLKGVFNQFLCLVFHNVVKMLVVLHSHLGSLLGNNAFQNDSNHQGNYSPMVVELRATDSAWLQTEFSCIQKHSSQGFSIVLQSYMSFINVTTSVIQKEEHQDLVWQQNGILQNQTQVTSHFAVSWVTMLVGEKHGSVSTVYVPQKQSHISLSSIGQN